MEFLEELREKVVKETIWDEEKYFALSRDLKRIKTLPEADARKLLFEAMSYTGTWLSTRDLSEVLKITIGSSRRTLSSQLKNNREDTDRFKQIVEKINADYVTRIVLHFL